MTDTGSSLNNMNILVTEWKPFGHPDLAIIRRLKKGMVIFDGRNQYNPDQMKAAGFEYFGIRRGDGGPNRGAAWPTSATRLETTR